MAEFNISDRVMGLTEHAYAELAAVACAEDLILVPDDLDLERAATLPLAGLTVVCELASAAGRRS